jgi:CubicO group peptidase (beta-lactamase class C family)
VTSPTSTHGTAPRHFPLPLVARALGWSASHFHGSIRKVLSILVAKGYGFADKGRGVPFTPDTVMNIGSISKTFTGVALMRAVQEGKLSLDQDINSYLPFKVINPHYPNAKITLRHWQRTPRASRTGSPFTRRRTTTAATSRSPWGSS